MRSSGTLPLPPLEMRELVGRTDPAAFEPPKRQRVFENIKRRRQYDLVLDFGCGCGRVARQLALARGPMPRRYVGLDLHAGMVAWCQENLAPQLPGFSFVHQDVYNPGLNPGPALPPTMAFPVEDQSVTLLIAVSVFTHLIQEEAVFYLDEVQRVLALDGVIHATFFLFEKRYFPMMQDFQNALYINPGDPTNAVIFDREWLLAELAERGLAVTAVTAPDLRGFQWDFEIRRGRRSVDLAPDRAPFGRRPPPVHRG